MENQTLINEVVAKANGWLTSSYDENTKAAVKELLEKSDKTELIDSFYRDLEFGTGGLRGIMGVGSNRMNIYTVGAATQGLSNYIKGQFPGKKDLAVVIGYDCRNNSELFAKSSAEIFSANGIKAYLFEGLRPTPEISFAIRELKCQSGIVITASHNPKEYNGYKAYWEDGGQVVVPHDENIITEVMKIKSVDDIKFKGNPALIEILGDKMDQIYLNRVLGIAINKDVVAKQKDLKIVYTPIHGTGVKLVPMALRNLGFTNIINVPEQDVVSGNFPTVVSPNPEEPAALEMAIKRAQEVDADIVMATDPDADRLGIAIKDDSGKFILVNGNQTAMLLTWYMLREWKNQGKLTGNEFIVKTIVTSELIKDMAVKNGVKYFDVYTGFKWIAAIIREMEGKLKYICGGEESYGFLPGDFVRDKDAVASVAMMAEIAAWAKENKLTLFELLQNIYLEYGFSKEKMVYIVRKGKTGAEEIEQLMKDYRNAPPKTLAGSKVVSVKDYDALTETVDGKKIKIELPVTSNVLQFFTEDGSKVSVRPSGTEPKIKFYFEVKEQLADKTQFASAEKKASEKIDKIIADLNIK